MLLTSFSVTDWTAWAPGMETAENWKSWANGEVSLAGLGAPARVEIAPMLRRRLSRLGKAALRAATDVDAGPAARYVFASKHGESTLTLEMLKCLARDEPVSPAMFSLSVHNALAGILSIDKRNTRSHTAVAAGDETLCAGIIEALGLIAENGEAPVLLVYYDESVSDFYGPFSPDVPATVALAMMIGKTGIGGIDCEFDMIPSRRDGQRTSASHSFMRFLMDQDASWDWQGHSARYRCRRVGTA